MMLGCDREGQTKMFFKDVIALNLVAVTLDEKRRFPK